MYLRISSIVLTTIILIAKCHAQSYVPEIGELKMKIKSKAKIEAYSFPLSDVELTESVFREAMQADVSYLKFLEPDRLLSQFRTNAGLKAKAIKYGGWESDGLAGHSLGHYLSAMSMHYAVTSDTLFLNRINYIVDELAIIQKARGTGYVGAIPNEDSVFYHVALGNIRSHGFDLNGAWAPWYTIHKIMAGLMDAYLYADNAKALEINTGMADWVDKILRGLSYDEVQKMLRCEYGGMNEALVNTYALTGNKKYLDLSYRFHDNFVMDSLAVKVNPLPGKHSNTQVPKVIGAARRYELTGREEDLILTDFYWSTMVDHHTYAPGGNSNYEYLTDEDQLNDKLTDNTMETCNTHNMLKLTRHLFAVNPSADLMDYYERALYNHILASQNRDNGMVCYFVGLRMGTKKIFSSQEHDFTCCLGTGMENHVKYGESIYAQGADGSVFVNLFIPSVLDWKNKETKITLQSNIPEENKVTIAVASHNPTTFSLRIRKPEWVAEDIAFMVNGKIIDVRLDAYGYYVIDRKWKKDDHVTFELPMKLYARSMPDNVNRKAFFYGPVMLAGDMGVSEPDPVKGVPVFVTDDQQVDAYINRLNNGLFASIDAGNPEDVTFRPFYAFTDNYYSVYWDVFDSQKWKEQKEIYDQKKKEQADLERRTVDVLRIGEMQPERDHNLEGNDTMTGEDHTRKWRSTGRGGSFSFDLAVDPEKQNEIVITYWGMDNRGRTFDILINDEKIAEEDINKYHDSKFYDISYVIPKTLTESQNKVRVKIMARPGNEAGPVYRARTVTGN